MAESLKQQQQRVKLEQEYQAALSMSASLNTKIAKDLKAQVDAAGDLSDEMKSFVTEINSSITGLSDSASITKEILKLENEQKTLTASITAENRRLVEEKKFALDTAIEALRVEEKILQATENVDKQAQRYAESISSWLDGVATHARQIPVLGGLLGSMADTLSNSIRDKLGTATKQFVVDFRAGMEKGKSATAGLANAARKSGGSVFKSLFSWKIALLGIVGLFALAIMAMDKAEKAQISFREETGILRGQFDGLESKIGAVAGATFGMTGDLAQGAKLAGEMYNAFDGVEDISLGVLMNATKLGAGLGISVQAIGGVNKLFQNAFGSSQQLAQSMVNTTVNASKLAGVPADKVLKDMAESSEEVYKYFRGSPQALQKSAIQAAKLGTSIKKASESAKSLLNFEDSINSELEASAIIGRNINFNRARSLAANGDILGSQQAILKEVSKLGDLSKLNVYQQEALEKATGMTVGDMMNQQRLQRNLGKLDGERLKKANELIAKGADASKLTKEQLDKAIQQEKVENQRTTTLEGLQRMFENIAMQLGSILMPEAKGLLTWLQNPENQAKVKEFIEGIKEGFNTIRDTLTAVYEKVKPYLDKLLTSLGVIGGPESEGGSAQSAGKGFAIMAAAIMGLSIAGPILGGLLGLTSTLLGGIFKLGGGLVSTITSSMSSADKATQTTARNSGNVLVKLGQGIRSIGGGIGSFITSLGKGVGGAISAIGKGLGGALRGMSGGLAALANPAALVGLAAVVLAIEGIALAIRIAGPGLEPFGNMMKSIFEGISSIVVPIIDILVGGFIQLAEVIGTTIIGVMEKFAPIVQTVADAFVSIASIVGETLLGIFESITSILGLIIEKSGQAPQLLAMAAAITAIGVAMAALGGGAALGAAAGLVGAVFEAGTSLIGGKTPMEKLDELLTKGSAIGSFGSQIQPAVNGILALANAATPLLVLSSAVEKLAASLVLLTTAANAVDIPKIQAIGGTAGTVLGKGKGANLPDSIQSLALAVNAMAAVDNSKVIDKLEEVRKAVIVGALIEMDGEILNRTMAGKQEAFNKVNFASRLTS